MRFICIVIFTICSTLAYAQTRADSTQRKTIDTTHHHSARKAVYLSAILPGAGQIYNKKWWKAPIIYAAGGTLGYFVAANQHNYIIFRNGFRVVADTSNHQSTYIIGGINYNFEQLRTGRELYRKNRDLSIIGVVLVYVVNLVDANVDGHLFDFDMSDDLSLHWQPNMQLYAGGYIPSLTLKFNFK
jgi:TM2 domain-containing membrane protein YozV